jgi:hypothetical protein
MSLEAAVTDLMARVLAPHGRITSCLYGCCA